VTVGTRTKILKVLLAMIMKTTATAIMRERTGNYYYSLSDIVTRF